MSGVWGLGACQFSFVPEHPFGCRQLGIGNVLHDRTPRLQEDQLALNAGWLKSCPLLDKSGQKWILAGDGLSAYDPTATLAVPKGSALGAGWLGVAKMPPMKQSVQICWSFPYLS
jgi:hypothetical protein